MQSAIGSVAAAAEQAFIPYSAKVLEAMKPFMLLDNNEEDFCAHAKSIEIVGIVAMSVLGGKEWRPFCHISLKLRYQ